MEHGNAHTNNMKSDVETRYIRGIWIQVKDASQENES